MTNGQEGEFGLMNQNLVERIEKGSSVLSYKAGLEWPDERFFPYAEIFAKGLAKRVERLQYGFWYHYDKNGKVIEDELSEPHIHYSGHCFDAGLNWPHDRFLACVEIIANGLAKDAVKCLEAGKEWPDDRFSPVAEIIARGLAQSSRWSVPAGRDWPDERLLPYAKRIANKIAEDPKHSFCAGHYWSDEKFLPVAEIIASGVARDPEWSYRAGSSSKGWSDEKFLPVAGIIAKGVSKDYGWSELAREHWKNERLTVDILQTLF